jgi:hypothetical protein
MKVTQVDCTDGKCYEVEEDIGQITTSKGTWLGERVVREATHNLELYVEPANRGLSFDISVKNGKMSLRTSNNYICELFRAFDEARLLLTNVLDKFAIHKKFAAIVEEDEKLPHGETIDG